MLPVSQSASLTQLLLLPPPVLLSLLDAAGDDHQLDDDEEDGAQHDGHDDHPRHGVWALLPLFSG